MDTIADVEIREATRADIEAVAGLLDQAQEIHIAALPEMFRKMDREQTREFLRNLLAMGQNTILVAWHDEKAVGFVEFHIQMVPERNGMLGRQFVHVNSLAVDTAYRRRGIGRQLMEATEAWARRRRISEVVLNVYEFNVAALEFYAELGYSTGARKMAKKLGNQR